MEQRGQQNIRVDLIAQILNNNIPVDAKRDALRELLGSEAGPELLVVAMPERRANHADALDVHIHEHTRRLRRRSVSASREPRETCTRSERSCVIGFNTTLIATFLRTV